VVAYTEEMHAQKTLILVGGGHAHALFLHQWQKQSVLNTKLIVIDPHPQVPYTGMLPGFVAGHYTMDDLYIDLQLLTHAAGGSLVVDRVDAINSEQKTVRTASGQVYQYDVLSLDVGIHAQLDIPGFAEHAVAVKPLYDFAVRWEEFVSKQVGSTKSVNVTIIGGGVAGVELVLAAQYRLQQSSVPVTVTIIDRGQVLQAVSQATQSHLRKVLTKRDVRLVEGATVTSITASEVHTNTAVFQSDFTLGAAGPQPYNWLTETGLATTSGYIDVNSTLQTPQHSAIFAVGDCAHFVPYSLQKAGVYAVRQAPVLHHNISAYLQGAALQPFHPQRDYLKLISLGGKQAAADKWGRCWRGAWLWWLKNYIDTAFMKKLDNS
jgi:selenide,water dikinase